MTVGAGEPGPAGLKRLASDLLAGVLFLGLFLATGDIFLAVGAGAAVGVAQAAWMMIRRRPIDAMQWMSLGLVIVLGSVTIATHNPAFAVFKPSIFEACVGFMMLRPGWILRYTPAAFRDYMPRGLAVSWGYLWAGAMFALAAANLLVARSAGLETWAIFSATAPWVVIGLLSGLGALVFPPAVRRTARARGVDLSRPAARADAIN